MKNSQRFWRGLFYLLMISALCGVLALPIVENVPVRAAPQVRALTNIVISEFRTLGPSGANDEFVELFNPTNTTISIGGWTIRKSAGCGAASGTPLDTIAAGISLDPGQYYLSAGLSYSGATVPDFRDTGDWSIAPDGGIAVLNGATIIDQVGMCASTAYLEGNPLTPMSGSADQSYERKTSGTGGNCNDTDNNAADFLLNATSSNPQNLNSPRLACLGVTSVTSATPDGTYTTGASIDITVTFSGVVDVTGSPRLLLETGATDQAAIYTSGSGSNTLHFTYTVAAGDTSADLDYVSTNSLTLNGGTIVGVIGNAVLTLPSPGSPGSLGASKSIIINNNAAPSVVSFRRQTPGSTPTNADTLTFRATFSEAVVNVHPNDFIATGTTGTPTSITPQSSSVYDVTVSGGDLATFNGTVGLHLNTRPPLDITDTGGTVLDLTEPPAVDDETYAVDNIAPTVTISLAAGQANPASTVPVNFTVVFSEPIVATTFTTSDITQAGTANSVTWSLTDSGNHQTFALSATSLSSNGTVIPSIPAGRVTDVAGNGNDPSTNSTVTFSDTTAPTVTINQTSGQIDPTTTLPVRFTIVFSEPIDTRVFTASDITQNGTAAGVVWSIADTGNHQTFNLSATGVSGPGTLIPFLAANRVMDLVGNSNVASTGTDGTVTYNSTLGPVVVISEFRTQGPSGANDEFVELYNPTANWVDISSWRIHASNDTGTPSLRVTIPASTILRSGQYYLIANNSSGGYSGSVTPNLTYGTGISDKGGIALYRANNSIADQVGMSSASYFKEGTPLTPFSGNRNQSYERKLGGVFDSCQDTNDNTNDFSNVTPSDPQNASSPLSICGNPGPTTLITTTTTITAHTPNPALAYENVSVSVKVTGSSLSPAGTKVNITATGLSTGCTITLNASGTGTCTIKFTYAGTKTITAKFLGDNTHLGSSTSVSHQVVISTPTKYRTATPKPPPPPPLLGINEFVPRPGHDWNHDGVINNGDEYIELLNFGVIDVNLSGYSLDDEVNIGSSPYRLPAGTLKPGERIVFYGSQTGLQLSDGGDAVRLLKPNGQLADAYNYSVVRFPDESFCRLPDNGGLDDWNQFCFPTPGLPNSQSESSVNPPISADDASLCPIADTVAKDFAFAECPPFGIIWNPAYWDLTGWFDEKFLPGSPNKWPLFGN